MRQGGFSMSKSTGRLFGLTLALLFAISAFAQNYWARYRVYVPNELAAEMLADSSLALFSDEITLGTTDVIIGPGDLQKLREMKLFYTFVSTLPDPRGWIYKVKRDGDYTTKYLTYDEIIAQYEVWRQQNPKRISRTQIGTTHEGRAVWVYRLNSPRPSKGEKINVVILGGTHAREWISPPVAMYVFHELLEKSKTSGQHAGLLDKLTLHVVPVLNPDGYVYTWTNDRYWRKNRRNNGEGSYGVDLNRNYEKAWGGEGSSGNKWSDVYRGPYPFSEPETSSLRDYVSELRGVAGFIDYHSYGQKILWPWSYTYNYPPDKDALNASGAIIQQGILDAGGKYYENGQASWTLYIASGVSKDWFYDAFDAMSFTIELRDTGQYGFLLPENQINPTQKENWGGFEDWLFSLVQ